MKLAINLALSLAMLAVCVWLVWPADPAQLSAAFRDLELSSFWPYLAGYLVLLALTHFARAYRWNYLLAPIGATQPLGRLMAISSVGFMAILALPARLGEFVRPALIRREGQITASAALGTVAVERIVDGLLVSLFVFGAFVARRGPGAPDWMMPTAYTALGVFAAAMVFLAFALRWPKETVRFSVRLSLLPRLSARLAAVIEDKLLSMISGFSVLKDRRNLVIFCAWSIGYWIANALSLHVLALGFGLGLPLTGAFAVTGLVAVGITLPNSPGLIGQYHLFVKYGLWVYLGLEVAEGAQALAFAVVLHGVQVLWYLGVGALALMSRHVSFAEIVKARSEEPPP